MISTVRNAKFLAAKRTREKTYVENERGISFKWSAKKGDYQELAAVRLVFLSFFRPGLSRYPIRKGQQIGRAHV